MLCLERSDLPAKIRQPQKNPETLMESSETFLWDSYINKYYRIFSFGWSNSLTETVSASPITYHL